MLAQILLPSQGEAKAVQERLDLPVLQAGGDLREAAGFFKTSSRVWQALID